MAYCIEYVKLKVLTELLADEHNEVWKMRKRLTLSSAPFPSLEAVFTAQDSLTLVNTRHL